MFNKKETSLAHNSVTQLRFLKTTTILWHGEELYVYSPFWKWLSISWLRFNKMPEFYCFIKDILQWNQLFFFYWEYRAERKRMMTVSGECHCFVLCWTFSQSSTATLWEALIEMNVSIYSAFLPSNCVSFWNSFSCKKDCYN